MPAVTAGLPRPQRRRRPQDPKEGPATHSPPTKERTQSKGEVLDILQAELARVEDELEEARKDLREENEAKHDDYGDEAFDESSDVEEKDTSDQEIPAQRAPSRNKLKQASTMSSVKSRISQQSISAKQRAKIETLARSMSAADVRAMARSSMVLRQAMLNTGVTLEDMLPGGLDKRFGDEMNPRLRDHLERRRIETVVQVLIERGRLVAELEDKEPVSEASEANTSKQGQAQVHGPRGNPIMILSKAEQREIFDRKLSARRKRDTLRDATAGKLRQWRQKEHAAALSRQEQLRSDVETHLERASLRIKEGQERTKERTKKREVRQARKMEICSVIESRRRRAMERHYKETQERLRALAQTKDPLKAASTGSKLNRSATEKLDLLKRKEEHRREVRKACGVRDSLRSRELRLEQIAKSKRLEEAKGRAEKKVQEMRELRTIDEIDRELRFERLQRRMEHERAQAQVRVDRKIAFAESLDHMQAELDRLRDLARRDDFARAVARESAGAESGCVLPGPGEYDVGSTLNSVGGKMGSFDLARVKAAEEKAAASSPGPGAYEAF